MMIGAGVKIRFWITTSVKTRASLGVAEEEGSFERTSDGLRISSEHCMHRRISGYVVAQRLERVEIGFTITYNIKIVKIQFPPS